MMGCRSPPAPKTSHVLTWRTVQHQLCDMSATSIINSVEDLLQSPAASLHVLFVEKALYGVALDNIVGLEMAMYLCADLTGAALNAVRGTTLANDRSASIL